VFKQILVPLDGSPLAEAVLPHATVFAKAYGAQLVLMGVVDPAGLEVHEDYQRYVSPLVERGQEWFRLYLEEAADRRQREGVSTRTEVAVGPVPETISAYAERSSIDLIAMSTHGRSGPERWMLGSVTDRVLHHCHTPMLIIRPTEQGAPPPTVKTLIVPLDGSDLGEAALPYARDVARQMKLRAVLVEVVSPGLATYGEAEAFSGFPEEMIGHMEATAAEYLAGIAERFLADGSQCDTKVLVGPVSASLTEFAKTEPASLIAMSTHGRSGVARTVLGSVADRMVRSSGDAVLVVRPGGGEGRANS